MYSLKERTKQFSLEIIRLAQQIPYNYSTAILTKQLLRSATSVGANYRSALRARSKADFISKLAIAEEEADESCYWLDLLNSIECSPKTEIERMFKEANEITAILTSCSKTAKTNK